MGSNYSACANSGTRHESDYYETPYSTTEQLLETGIIRPNSEILEPASGGGAIVKVLLAAGHRVTIGDISTGQNFFDESRQFDIVLTNPPFHYAQEFVLKAKEVARHKIAFLLPADYLHGIERFETLWNDTDFPLHSVWYFTRYTMFGDPLLETGKYNTGMKVVAWFIWDRKHRGNAAIHWINNQKYILHEGEEGYISQNQRKVINAAKREKNKSR